MVDCREIESVPDEECDVRGSSNIGLLCLELSPGAGCSKSTEENHASSSQSCLRRSFVDMGFPPALVDQVLEEKGEENAELLLETLCAYSDVGKGTADSTDSLDELFNGAKLKDVKNESPDSTDSLNGLFNDCKDGETSAKFGTDGPGFEEQDAAFDVDKKTSLLRMNFSEQEVDSAVDRLGEDAPVDDLVEFIVASQVAKTADANAKTEDSATEILFCTMDVTLQLLEMGFSESEISSAIDRYGAEIPVEEIADSILANRIADTCFDKDEDQPVIHQMDPSHGENFRTSPEELSKRKSFHTLIAETEASSSRAFPHGEGLNLNGPKGKKPKLEYEDDSESDPFFDSSSPEANPFEPISTIYPKSLSQKMPHKLANGMSDTSKSSQQLETNTSSAIHHMVGNRPYFFYGNVLDVSDDTWRKVSQFLYSFDPEFVNTQFFSALSRKEGYIHNLPRDDRSYILPRSPMSIEDAITQTKNWWPSWDTRKQLSCINSETQGISQICERLEKMLVESQGVLSLEQQTNVLHQCKRLNLVWVGQYKLKHIEPEEVERILGYPVSHTQAAGSGPVERLGLLKHSFQTDTLGYHLSALKWIFPDGVTLLSLYSGIGGAEIAIHRLGVHLKVVVSVEPSETNRKILKRWWQNTQQKGKLEQVEDINKLTGAMVKSLINDHGGFDLVMCQSTLIYPEDPTAFDFFGFYEFVRVLQCVRSGMGC